MSPLVQAGYLVPPDVASDFGFQTAIEAPGVLTGQAFTHKVPGSFFEVPVTVAFVFGSDPTVVNRLARLEVLDGDGNRVTTVPGESVQAAGGIRLYTWTQAVTGFSNPGGSSSIGPLFPMVLPSGWSLRLTADNLQANDTISAVSIVMQQYNTGIEPERFRDVQPLSLGDVGFAPSTPGFSLPPVDTSPEFAPIFTEPSPVDTGPEPAPPAAEPPPTTYQPLPREPAPTPAPAPAPTPTPAPAPAPGSGSALGGPTTRL